MFEEDILLDDDYENLRIALDYAVDFEVIPFHRNHNDPFDFENGCSCGDPDCKQKGRHIKNEKLKPTQDEQQIKDWWYEDPNANVGIKAGYNSYVMLEIENGTKMDPPNTYSESYEDSICYYFKSERQHKSFSADGIIFTGDDGYIAVGKWYDNQRDIKELPDDLLEQLQSKPVADNVPEEDPIKQAPSKQNAHVTDSLKLKIINVPSTGKQQSHIKDFEFWNSINNKISIDEEKLIEFIEMQGVVRLDGSMRYVRIEEGIAEEISLFEIKNIVLDYVKGKKDVWKEIHKKSESFFSKTKMTSIASKPISYIRDTREETHLFYQNGVVEIGPTAVKLVPYENYSEVIHRDQKQNRDFMADTATGIFEKFVRNTSSYPTAEGEAQPNDGYYFRPSDFEGKMLAIGYLCSQYKDPSNPKCIIATDAYMDSHEINGRTGKSLFMKALSHIRNMKSLDGKITKIKERFSIQGMKRSHELVLIDDADESFKFEDLFHMVSGDMNTEDKYLGRVTIPFEDSPKICMTTNYLLKGDGASFSGRQHILEFSDFYNEERTPASVHGQILFEWSSEEWHRFDTFIVKCIQKYLSIGELQEPKKSNYSLYKLGAEHNEFINWAETLPLDTKMNQSDLQDNLKNQYSKYDGISTCRFNKVLKAYSKAKRYEINAHKKDNKDRDRNGNHYITLTGYKK